MSDHLFHAFIFLAWVLSAWSHPTLAKELSHCLKVEKPTVLVQDWFKDTQTSKVFKVTKKYWKYDIRIGNHSSML